MYGAMTDGPPSDLDYSVHVHVCTGDGQRVSTIHTWQHASDPHGLCAQSRQQFKTCPEHQEEGS